MPKLANRYPITFAKACKLVQKATACIFDGNALSYPCINEDFNGNDCIEVNYNDENGLCEFSFGLADEYYITKDGILEIWKDDENGQCYSLQFLKITKVK